MDDIKVVVTMDCEPTKATTHAAATGPDTWALGERAVRGFARIASEHALPVTYFIHPEAAIAQSALFAELQAQGACLGLHVHPWKYAMFRPQGEKYLEHYGALSEDAQRELLSETGALWAQALGRWPAYFRSGTFSANDATFRVLAELGFRGGSCSLPGRVMPEMRAVWAGAAPDPHRAHASFRQLEGRLGFVEMPVSVDFSVQVSGKLAGKMNADLRPDIDWWEQYQITYQQTAQNIVAQISERNPDTPVINLVTHNHFDYSDDSQPAAIRLRSVIQAIEAACRQAGVRMVGATIADVCDAVLSRPAKSERFICDGNVYTTGSPTALTTLDNA